MSTSPIGGSWAAPDLDGRSGTGKSTLATGASQMSERIHDDEPDTSERVNRRARAAFKEAVGFSTDQVEASTASTAAGTGSSTRD